MNIEAQVREFFDSLGKLPYKKRQEIFSIFEKFPELLPKAAHLFIQKKKAITAGESKGFSEVIKKENQVVEKLLREIQTP